MTQKQDGGRRHPGGARATLLATSLALLLAGCALISSKVKSPAPVPPVAARPTAIQPVPGAPADTSLAAIVNNQILRGHYDEAEQALRSYLVQHPDDHPAQSLLRQLTVDPRKMLGRQSTIYVVRPGDSYSTLAARYLGNAGLFLVLARYNGATNPSLLRAGQSLHMPSSAVADGQTSRPEAAASTAPAETVGRPARVDQAAQNPTESPQAKATRLQREGVALMKQGKSDQALDRLDQALTIDPQLPSSGAAAVSLRKHLVDRYHQRAIVLYRDQKLDQAITLWNRALAIDPGFEPALIYRARAMELQRRLKQL